jgi:hypothetical protein
LGADDPGARMCESSWRGLDERSEMEANRSKLVKASAAVAVALAFYGGIALVISRRALSVRAERWTLEHMNPYAGGPLRRPRA